MTAKKKSSLPITFDGDESTIHVAYDRGSYSQPAGVVMNFAFVLGLCIFKLDAALARKVGEQLIIAADAANKINITKDTVSLGTSVKRKRSKPTKKPAKFSTSKGKPARKKYPKCLVCKGTSFVAGRVCRACEGTGENRL
jgi:hypothetical protein